MGLDDPTKKMSKSAKSEYNYIALTDDPEIAAKKIMKATTDSEGVVKYDVANKPGVSNLLVILSLLTDKKIDVLEKEFAGKGYGDFKKAVAEEVKIFLTKFQKRYYSINDQEVLKILKKGSKKLQKLATIKINDVKKKIGVI
jgi:tryptophanyl-tRNA synthetase